MRRFYSWALLLFAFCVLPFALAQAQQNLPDPIPVLHKISNQMIQSLQDHKASMQKNPQVVYKIVHQILLPHADLPAMARSALGRDAWVKATPAQQAKFIDAFTDLMIHTYGAGLSSYNDQTVKFMPIRGGITSNRVEVSSQIIRSDGPPISVSYRLIFEGNEWKVYDFSVEGVSMINSFRSQFASELSNGMDIDSLTHKLKQHNENANGNA